MVNSILNRLLLLTRRASAVLTVTSLIVCTETRIPSVLFDKAIAYDEEISGKCQNADSGGAFLDVSHVPRYGDPQAGVKNKTIRFALRDSIVDVGLFIFSEKTNEAEWFDCVRLSFEQHKDVLRVADKLERSGVRTHDCKGYDGGREHYLIFWQGFHTSIAYYCPLGGGAKRQDEIVDLAKRMSMSIFDKEL